MGFLSRLIGREQKSAPRYGTIELFRDLLTGGRAVKSGVTVTTERSLQVTTVLGVARVLAEDVSGLPLKLIEQKGNARIYLPDDPVQQLLDWPNEWQTGEEFREQLMLHAVLTGNGVAYKNVVRGQVAELLPLMPGWYTLEQTKDWGLVCKVRLPDGTAFNLGKDGFLHLRGPAWSGFAGMDVVRLAREAIGLAMATEDAHARLHGNGLKTSGLYSVEGQLESAQYTQLKAHIEAEVGGDSAFKPLILDRSAKFTPITMNGVDSQHLETRRFQIEEICRAARVFPQMVGYSDKTSTFASAEAFFLAHVKYSLLPWIRRWERTIARDLLGRARRTVRAKHNVAALERADIKTRYTAYGQGIKDGWLLRNEARSWEDLDEIEGLSEPLQPLNMATPDQAKAGQDEKPAGGEPIKGRRPFSAETRARTYVRDSLGRFATFEGLLAAVFSGAHPKGLLARIGKMTGQERQALRKAGLGWSGTTVHAEDRVLKKAMRTVGSRKPATAADLRAIPTVMGAGGAKSYIDTQNRTLVRVVPAPDADDLVVKYVIRPASPQGSNRLVTVQRMPAAAIGNSTHYRPV